MSQKCLHRNISVCRILFFKKKCAVAAQIVAKMLTQTLFKTGQEDTQTCFFKTGRK